MINISTTAKRLVLRRHSAFDNLHRQPQLLGRTLALMIISSVVAQTSATAGAVRLAACSTRCCRKASRRTEIGEVRGLGGVSTFRARFLGRGSSQEFRKELAHNR